MDHLQHAADLVGGRAALAERLALTPQAVGHWFTGIRQIPAEQCVAIERITAGKVKRRDLRPDIFGPVQSGRSGRSTPKAAA